MAPAWSQEPAAFDLKSDAIKNIVSATAATQFADVQIEDNAPVKTETAAFKYVSPEKPVAAAPDLPSKPPAQTPRSDSFVSAMFDILVDELLGIEDDDGVTVSNEMLNCRVQRDLKTLPPGTNVCPGSEWPF